MFLHNFGVHISLCNYNSYFIHFPYLKKNVIFIFNNHIQFNFIVIIYMNVTYIMICHTNKKKINFKLLFARMARSTISL